MNNFYILLMKTVMNNWRTMHIVPTARLLTPVTDVMAGMDTRNITDPQVDIQHLKENYRKFHQLKTLQSINTHPMKKLAIAELCLDELLYPGERVSKFTMSPMAGGLFRGWDDDED